MYRVHSCVNKSNNATWARVTHPREVGTDERGDGTKPNADPSQEGGWQQKGHHLWNTISGAGDSVLRMTLELRT